MVTILLLVSALAGLFSTAEGQDFRFGKCPTPPVQEDFDLTKFLGIWYEIEKIPAPFEKGNCVQVNYTALENGNIKAIKQLQKSDGSVRQTTSEIIRANLAEPAKMGLKYPSSPRVSPYWVLATDYDNYALVYSCSSTLSLFHLDYAWILGRSPSLPLETIIYLKGILASNNINIGKMTATNQENCN
ncbi:apolipoprotein D [Hipposideros larvatus]